jgi:hypothetical protein
MPEMYLDRFNPNEFDKEWERGLPCETTQQIVNRCPRCVRPLDRISRAGHCVGVSHW